MLSYLYYVQGGVGGWWLWLEYGIFALAVALELYGQPSRDIRE